MSEDCKKFSTEISCLSAEVTSLKDGIAGIFNEVVELKYREGLEKIEASHEVYTDGVSTNLHNWARRFDGFASELETEYRRYTNSDRVRHDCAVFHHWLYFDFRLDFKIFEDYQ